MYMQIKCLFLSFPRNFLNSLNEYKGALSKHGRKTIDWLYISDHIWDKGVKTNFSSNTNWQNLNGGQKFHILH